MKYLLLFIFFILQFNSFTQLKWFIEPRVNFNLPFSYVDPSYNNSTDNKWIGDQTVNTPFFSTISKRFIPKLGVRVGLGVGALSDNRRHLFQLEWSADRATLWVESSFERFNSTSSNGVGAIHHRRYNRFGGSYAFNFLPPKGVVRPWVQVGLGLNINTNGNDIVPHYQGFGDYWLTPQVQLKEIYVKPFAENRVNGYLKIGLMSDFYAKDKYLFTFGFYYTQGLGKYLTRVEYTTELNVNNEHYNDKVGLMSRGTAINFQISRRLQFYPWIKSKRKELQEQGVYKSREK